MSIPRDILLRVQRDSFGRILAAEWLADVAVILEERAVTDAEAKKLLGTVKGRSGKVGACILVPRPIVVPESDNSAGRGQLVQAFTVLEHPTINAQSNGTKKTAQEIAVELFDLFQFAAVSFPNQVFSAFPGGAIVPDDAWEGLNAWEVRFQTFVPLRRTTRVGRPLIDPEEGAAPQNVTITCGTAGAAIYYTLDSSYPSSANPAATLYSGPVPIAAAATLRAAAEKDGLQPSDVAEATFT